MKAHRILLLLLYFCFFMGGTASVRPFGLNERLFINKSVDIDHIEVFFQDSIGRVWGGSYLNGMMMFDGETLVSKTPQLHYCGVRCQLEIDGTTQLIGTRNGLYLFRLDTFGIELVPNTMEHDVIGLSLLADGNVLVFLADKIAVLDRESRVLEDKCSIDGFSLVKQVPLSEDEYLLMTDYKGLYTYKNGEKAVCPLPLKNLYPDKKMLLAMVSDGEEIWIGSDKDLMKYRLGSDEVEYVKELNDICVKTLMLAEDRSLWVGTDNGLYIYSPNGIWEHYCHDNQNERSLLSNCVWSIYEDNEGNKWLGVDGGFSFIRENYPMQGIKWKDLIPTRDGNRITEILHDSHGDYWFGGVSGLGLYSPTQGKGRFFKVGASHSLVNNRIREIYEDKNGTVWIGTDGGFCWYDRRKETFVPCNVMNPRTGKTSVWTYGLAEDKDGNFYISTCSGGIFVADKAALKDGMTSPLYNYHYEMDAPFRIQMHGCFGMAVDALGDVWVNGGRHLYKMTEAGKPLKEFFLKNSIGNLFCDVEGTLWGCASNNFFRIHTATDSIEYIPAETYTSVYGQINCMTVRGNHVWFLTEKGVGILDKNTLKFRHLVDFSDSKYKSCYYDAREDRIWLGGVDNCLLLNPSACLEYSRNLAASGIVSALYVNEEIVAGDVAYSSGLTLDADENNLAFRVSLGVPVQDVYLQHGYCYRLSGLDEAWRTFNIQTPLIKYSYLDYGNYCLEIGKLNEETGAVELLNHLPITIKAPWYHTWWFRLLLFAFLVALCVSVINHFRLRAKLRIAESEKNNMLKLSQMKMDFLVNVSHELKTPLSLMLEPVNQLAANARSSQTKALSRTLQKNVKRLSRLVHQMIDYQQGNSTLAELSLAEVELVEFVRSIVSAYAESMEPKGVKVEFVCEEQELYTEADMLKLEAVINNLLSNACKFTPEGGKVRVEMQKQAEESGVSVIYIKVSDTGVGIAEEDLPYIFERFYQSKEHLSMNQDGSGIGLSMVKNYISQHGGEVTVTSEKGVGTTFTLSLPVLSSDADRQLDAWTGEEEGEQLRVLIVEDNAEIARFMAEHLKGVCCKLAHNGRSGMEMALEWHPDLIITDMMMPVMDGLEMCRQLKKNVETKTIPVIMLTAKDNEQSEQDAYRLGVDAFISKPFEMDYLMLRIRQLVKSRVLLARQTDAAPREEASPVEERVLGNDLRDEKFLQEITALIERHLEDADLNVQKLANLSGYHAKVIYRRLKALMGTTAVDYIKSIRLKKAAMLLSQRKFTVSEVMYMVGFSNHSYFAKCFAEKYGKTPKAYMEEGI